MEWRTKLRLEVLGGKRKKREVLRSEGIGWETLKKILEYSQSHGYRLKEPRPKAKIGSYPERIAQIIEEDKALPKKKRHTAKRFYECLRERAWMKCKRLFSRKRRVSQGLEIGRSLLRS